MIEADFIYRFVCGASQGMSQVVMGASIERLLTGRDDRLSKRKRLACWFVLGCGLDLFKCLFPMPDWYLSIGNTAVKSTYYVLLLKYFYSDKVWLKFTHASMVILQNILADVIHMVILGEIGNGILCDYANPYMAKRCVSVAMLSALLNVIYTAVVLRIKKKEKINSVWIAVSLQFFLAFAAVWEIWRLPDMNEDYDRYFMLICVVSVLEFALLMLYLSQSEKQEAEAEAARLQKIIEEEKVHYQELEQRREEMAKLRHDYDTILTSVMNLLEDGKTTEAETVLQDLSVRISATREYPFCPIPIINAILTEKQKVCEAEGISLSVDLMIPDAVGAADLDLCMIFGNLMDNAIRACREVSEKGQQSHIVLQGGMVQEYLIIKCKNAALENRENKIWGTGYGHKILTDIARKYHGDFQTMYEEGNFMAQISLGVISEIGR